MKPSPESRAKPFCYVRGFKIFYIFKKNFGMIFESALISIILILELSVFIKSCSELKACPESRARPFSYVRALCARPIFFISWLLSNLESSFSRQNGSKFYFRQNITISFEKLVDNVCIIPNSGLLDTVPDNTC